MIVKYKSFKKPHFGRLLKYMTDEKKRLFDGKGGSFAVTHNLKGLTIDKWEKQFMDNDKFRNVSRKDSIYLSHEILSWHKDDAKDLTLDKMKEIATEYINKRNPNGMYVCVPHFDKDHYHIHICASGVEYRTGKALRLSKAEFGTLKKDIQKYQIEKFPEIKKSSVEHGKKEKNKLTEKEYKLKQRTGRETQKEQLMGMLKTCYKKAESKEDFYNKLRECGINTYERGGKISGVVFDETKHRFKGLGYEEKFIESLDKITYRGKELGEVRGSEMKNTKQPERNNPKGEESNKAKKTEQGDSKNNELNEVQQQTNSKYEELRGTRENKNKKTDEIEKERN